MFSLKRFRVLFAESGMSVKEFAERCGINAVAVSKILNHKTNPTLQTVGKLAKGLNVSAAELLTDE